MAFSDSGDIESRLLAEAAEDEGFPARLICDPKAAISAAFEINLPDRSDIQVRQNTATTRHFILSPSDLLAESDLQMVAAGERLVVRTAGPATGAGSPRLNRPARRWKSCLPRTSHDHAGFYAARWAWQE